MQTRPLLRGSASQRSLASRSASACRAADGKTAAFSPRRHNAAAAAAAVLPDAESVSLPAPMSL